MRRYSTPDEQRIRAQAQVRDWTRAGLLSAAQGAQIEAELRVPLRRTGRMLRLGLAVFTAIAVAAAIGFVIVLIDINSERAVSMILILGGVLCCAGADRLVSAFRLYRHGVEEALAVLGVAFIAGGSALLVSSSAVTSDAGPIVSGLVIAAAGGFAVYLRFGFLYAAVAAMVCAALIPFQLPLTIPSRHLAASVTLAGLFAWARHVRRAHDSDLVREDARTFEATAGLGMYVVLNLHVIGWVFGIGGGVTLIAWFKWITYVLVWMLPPLMIGLGIRDRERLLIDVGIVAFLATLMTNKLYLGVARNPWDPIVFGVLVGGAAVALRRWMAAAPGEVRNGFTAARVSGREGDVLTVIGTASTALHPVPASPPDRQQPPEFGGGRSGGGGAGADF